MSLVSVATKGDAFYPLSLLPKGLVLWVTQQRPRMSVQPYFVPNKNKRKGSNAVCLNLRWAFRLAFLKAFQKLFESTELGCRNFTRKLNKVSVTFEHVEGLWEKSPNLLFCPWSLKTQTACTSWAIDAKIFRMKLFWRNRNAFCPQEIELTKAQQNHFLLQSWKVKFISLSDWQQTKSRSSSVRSLVSKM